QEVQPLRFERIEVVELVEAALVQLEIRLEHGQLLRDVADASLERADLGGQPRDLLRQVRFLVARGGELGLHLADAVAVVARGRSGEEQAADGQDRETARHRRRFGGTSHVPAGGYSAFSSGARGPGSGMIAGCGGSPSSGGGGGAGGSVARARDAVY